MRTCSIEGCEKKHWGKGWCQAHYNRALRMGHPERRPVDRSHRLSIPERLWLKRQVTENGCWLWTGTKADTGYGQLSVKGRPYSVHRLAYSVLVEPIPSGLEIDHLCCNRACFNPLHLEPVTHIENVRRGFARRAATA